MNTKEMVTFTVAAMVVVTMFASSAMAITADGKVDPAGEWATGDKLVDDVDTYPGFSHAYNISSMWAHYDSSSGTMYFRLDVYGTPGDMYGIGDSMAVGPDEYYEIHIDSNTDGVWDANDYNLVYNDGAAKLLKWNGTSKPKYGDDTGETVHAAHDVIVEFAMPANGNGYIDPTYFCIKGWADNDPDELGEDPTPTECRTDEPPTVVCNFYPISCGQGTLSGTGSSDNGEIVEYAWDFGNDGSYDDYGETVPYSTIGTQDVRLMVTDDLGQTANCTIDDVTLTGSPIADAVADGDVDDVINLPADGKVVTFCDESPQHPYHPDAWIVSCEWTILGQTYTTNPGECVDVFINETTTAYLKVIDNHDCEATDTITLRKPPTQKVPLLTPLGAFALIGMLCIAGAGRVLTKGRRS